MRPADKYELARSLGHLNEVPTIWLDKLLMVVAFIGLHLAEALLSQGHQVTILNDGDEVGSCDSLTPRARIYPELGNFIWLAMLYPRASSCLRHFEL